MDNINQSQKERLAHIDFRLYFLGVVGRSDIVNRFGVKAAAATRDLALYKGMAPGNLVYHTTAKQYQVTDGFKPLFNYHPDRVLHALSTSIGDDMVVSSKRLIPCETPSQLNKPNLDVLSIISRGIYGKRPLKITYRSISNGLSTREVVPFCLVDNGLRWHIRAFDRKRERFTDFVITRITHSELILSSEIKDHELSSEDIQWNRIVELQIVAHPELEHKETIELDYGMENGILPMNIRAAVAGYLLRRWNIDCSPNGTLKGAEYHLWLKNRHALYGVDNLVLAPGYYEE